MNVLETVTCCVLALVTFAVFRKELLKVKDTFLAFWIPQKRKKARDGKNKRQESNKENLIPSHTCAESTVRTSSPLKTMENGAVTKEMVSMTETTSKITEEKEGIRIKSATLLPDNISFPSNDGSFEHFTSQKLSHEEGKKIEDSTSVDPFPIFSDLLGEPPKLPMPPIDTSTFSKTEEVSSDDRSYTKTVTERKHEVKGNTDVSFMQKEEQSVSKFTVDGGSAPSISLDAMDLNTLINETQKKIDSFTNGFKTDVPKSEVQSTFFETQKKTDSFTDGFKTDVPKSEVQSTLFETQKKTNSFTDGFKTDVPKSEVQSTLFETQKKTNSFTDGFKTDVPKSEVQSTLFEVKKTETTQSMTEKTSSETFCPFDQKPFSNTILDFGLDSLKDIQVNIKQSDSAKKVPPPIPPKPKNRPLSEPFVIKFKDCLNEMDLSDSVKSVPTPIPSKPKDRPLSESFVSDFKDRLKEMDLDLSAFNGGLGFTSDESSFVTTESPFGSTMITKKKKMFSSSSFYEEPEALYPTIEEQVEMARKIAGSLADDTNKKSKGANMFYKRLKRSTKWIHEGPEPSDESGPGTPEIEGAEPPTPDISQVPFRPSFGPSKLKLVLAPRHPLDANALRQSGVIINEHNVISPDMCYGLVKDLHSPVGKGAALFAKRKKKSEEWVVDEEKVKALMREQDRRMNVAPSPVPGYNQYSTLGRQDVKLVKTPWEAAMESPYGLCDAAFARVSPDQLADTVIKAADIKRRNSNTPSRCMSPPPLTPAGTQYDIYHAKAPKGWLGTGARIDSPSYFSTPQAPTPLTTIPQGATSGVKNGFQTPRKMVFQNFNTVPRQWKGSTR